MKCEICNKSVYYLNDFGLCGICANDLEEDKGYFYCNFCEYDWSSKEDTKCCPKCLGSNFNLIFDK